MERTSLDGGVKRRDKVKIKQATLLFYSIYSFNLIFLIKRKPRFVRHLLPIRSF